MEDYGTKKAIAINILNFNYLERNSYHSIARMKFEKTEEGKFVDLGYTEGKKSATDAYEMHYIELQKFKKKNPDVRTKLEQWLWLIIGDKEDKIKMAEKENEEIKKTVEILDELSADDLEREKYEARWKALTDYNTEMYWARREGLEERKK